VLDAALVEVLTSINSSITSQVSVTKKMYSQMMRDKFQLVAETSEGQADELKIKVLKYYGYPLGQDDTLPVNSKCMITGTTHPTSVITMAHIFARKWRNDMYLLGLDNIDSERNLLLLYKPIEYHFGSGDIIFLWDDSEQNFVCRVLNPNLKDTLIDDEGIVCRFNLNTCLMVYSSSDVQKTASCEDQFEVL
jgi:HNH endonuclease